MLLVKTKLAPSPIHGLGLFADQFIPKGTITWQFTPGFDRQFTKEQILSFSEATQRYLCVYCWKSKKTGKYYLSSDNEKYINHSENNNILSGGDGEVYRSKSIRDIEIGEEITDNYNSYEEAVDNDNVLKELAKKHKIIDTLEVRRDAQGTLKYSEHAKR